LGGAEQLVGIVGAHGTRQQTRACGEVPSISEVTMTTKLLYAGGLKWQLLDSADMDGVRDKLTRAMEAGEVARVQLEKQQELLVNGARLEYFLVWEATTPDENPPVGRVESIVKEF
jgi:hypothetical protein